MPAEPNLSSSTADVGSRSASLKGAAGWLLPATVVLAGALVFFPVLSFPFVWDDHNLIRNNPYLDQPRFLQRAMLSDFWQWTNSSKPSGMYRPLVWLDYWLELRLWGRSPWGFHLTGLLLHLLNSLLVFGLCRRWLVQSLPAAFGAAVFCLHPVQVTAVANITSRTDLLATAFTLLGVRLWVARGAVRWLALPLLSAAMLSKESALVAPALAVVFAMGCSHRAPLRSVVSWLPVLSWVPVLALRRIALDAMPSRPLEQSEGGVRVVQYLVRVLFPAEQPPYVELAQPSSAWKILSLALLLGLGFALRRLPRRPRAALSWTALCLLPISELYPLGSRFSDLLLYLPLTGVALFLSSMGDYPTEPGRNRTAMRAGATLLLAICAFGTVRSLPAWSSEVLLWQRGVSLSPDHALMNLNLGTSLARAGEQEAACERFVQALGLPSAPDSSVRVKLLFNAGNCARAAGDRERALALYQSAYALSDHSLVQALHNQAVVWLSLGRLEEALRVAEQVVREHPTMPAGHRLLGVVRARVDGVRSPSLHGAAPK